MKTRLIWIISFLLFGINIYAQDVDGVDCSFMMSKNMVIARFGEPEEYTLDYDDYGDKIEGYDYGNGDWIEFVNGVMYGFCVSTPRWPVLVNMVEGGIRIGDPFSKLASFNPQPVDWLDGVSDMYYIPSGDFPIFISTSDNIITQVDFEIRHE